MDSGDLEKQYSWLRRRARQAMGSRLRGWTESGDLAQRVQYEALRGSEGKTFPNLSAFRGWLLRILRNLAASESRRRGIEQVVGGTSEVAGAGHTPSRIVEARDSESWMRDRLMTLEERERDVVLARIVDGLSFAKIGRRFAITEGYARLMFHRTLQKLQLRNDLDPPA